LSSGLFGYDPVPFADAERADVVQLHWLGCATRFIRLRSSRDRSGRTPQGMDLLVGAVRRLSAPAGRRNRRPGVVLLGPPAPGLAAAPGPASTELGSIADPLHPA